jgi:hypothetical protein
MVVIVVVFARARRMRLEMKMRAKVGTRQGKLILNKELRRSEMSRELVVMLCFEFDVGDLNIWRIPFQPSLGQARERAALFQNV